MNFLNLKKNLFLQFVIGKIRKFPYENLKFFSRQAIPKIIFPLNFTYTGDTPYRVWFVWKAPGADNKILFLKIVIPKIFAIFRM